MKKRIFTGTEATINISDVSTEHYVLLVERSPASGKDVIDIFTMLDSSHKEIVSIITGEIEPFDEIMLRDYEGYTFDDTSEYIDELGKFLKMY